MVAIIIFPCAQHSYERVETFCKGNKSNIMYAIMWLLPAALCRKGAVIVDKLERAFLLEMLAHLSKEERSEIISLIISILSKK